MTSQKQFPWQQQGWPTAGKTSWPGKSDINWPWANNQNWPWDWKGFMGRLQSQMGTYQPTEGQGNYVQPWTNWVGKMPDINPRDWTGGVPDYFTHWMQSMPSSGDFPPWDQGAPPGGPPGGGMQTQPRPKPRPAPPKPKLTGAQRPQSEWEDWSLSRWR